MTQIFYLLLLLPLASCISMSNLTTRGAASIVAPSEVALQDISDLESWRRGGPAGIQMLEGMHEASPDNTDITTALAKAYNGYATLVAETDMLDDTISDRSFSSSKNLAIDYHSRAIAHAKDALKANNLTWSHQSDTLNSSLSHLSPSDQKLRDLIFIAAQSLKSLIGLKRGSVAFLDLQTTADILVKWTCDNGGPSYPLWGCKAMSAVELAERPVVAGGNPTLAKQELDKLIAAYPDDLMLVALKAQFVLTKIRDPKSWQESKLRYQKYLADKDVLIKQRVTEQPPRDKNALANAAAAERLRILIQHEKDLF